jgi:hypothetical protein
MNKYVKYGLFASAIIVGGLLISKLLKKDEVGEVKLSTEDKQISDLLKRIDAAKK